MKGKAVKYHLTREREGVGEKAEDWGGGVKELFERQEGKRERLINKGYKGGRGSTFPYNLPLICDPRGEDDNAY